MQLGSLRIPSHTFLETLPAKPVTTSCKNRFFRRQRTYYAMEVLIRLDNKLLVMTRRNRTAIRYFRHCWNRDNLVPRVFLFSNMAAAPERCINAYAQQGEGGGVLMGITWALNFTKPVLETFEFHSSNWLQKYRRGCFRTCTWSRQGLAVLSISKNAPQVSQAHVTSVLCKSIYITHSQSEPGTPVIARTFSPFYSCKIMSLKSQWTLTWRGRKWAQWRSV